jgi:hypothetical protein
MFGEYIFRGRLPPFQQQVRIKHTGWSSSLILEIDALISLLTQLAVVMMCIGAALAGLTDLTFSFPGYFWAMVGSRCRIQAEAFHFCVIPTCYFCVIPTCEVPGVRIFHSDVPSLH